MMIFSMNLEVLGKIFDALTQERDLHFRGAGIALMNPELLDPSMDGGARLERSSSRIPMLRIGEPEEVAQAALYLASDESAWVTGLALVIDGGVTVKGP